MKSSTAVARLAALAQPSRLAAFRALVRAGPEGLCVGDLRAKLRIPLPTLSFHLKELARSGLICSRQDGRFVHYAPDFAAMNALLSYLTANCCVDSGRKCFD